MLRMLKRLVIFVFLSLFGRSRRKTLVDLLTSKSRRRHFTYNVENIPAELDDIVMLPEGWQETLIFAAFDTNGLCAKFNVERNEYGCRKASFAIDIPSYGSFRYDENGLRFNNNQLDEDLCEGLKLKLYCQQAMVRWRVFLRGRLRDNNGESQHATVSLYWNCLFDPYDHFAVPSLWIRAKHLTCLSWSDILTKDWDKNHLCYEQMGELRGRIILENHKPLDVRLNCMRERLFTGPCSVKIEKVSREHIVVDETGFAISNSFIKMNNGSIETFGYISYPIGDSEPVIGSLLATQDEGQITSSVSKSQSYSASSETYYIENKLIRFCFSEDEEQTAFVRCTVNGKLAFGLNQRFDGKLEDEEIQTQISVPAKSHVIENSITVVSLDDEICKNRCLVGGKASNLARLRQTNALNIPNGICVTINAFNEHIAMNEEVKKSIESIIWTNSKNLQDACTNAATCLQEVSVSGDLLSEMRNKLICIYGENDWNGKKFAVRSSCECEDSPELSTAGQMDSFLAVHGFDNVVEAIKKCWASSVSHRVVEYRRQNGQSLVEGMGVLVQEMVEADTAGVLFTSDPVTANESFMVINASFGLGEAVVSGQVNPDTIRISRKHNDKIVIEKYEPGEKLTKIVIDDATGTKYDQITGDEMLKPCLSMEEIQLICKNGLDIEKILGPSQDIEWAISRGRLFILQARPINVLDSETDDDIFHEFDRPVINRNLLFTTANIQEVLPGAVSTLTGDITVTASNVANRRSSKARLSIECPIHPFRHLSTHAGVPLFCFTGLGLIGTMLLGDAAKSEMELNFMGEIAEEHKLETIKDYYGRPFPSPIKRQLNVLRVLLFTNRHEAKLFDILRKKACAFSIGEGAATAKELFKSIDDNISFYDDIFYGLISKSMLSGTWIQIIMKMLSGNQTEVMADMALILSGCKNVCSANVPITLNSLAESIVNSGLKDKFLETPEQYCDELVRDSGITEVTDKYIQFLKEHGHRCMREAELYVKSWSQDPSQLIATLKLIIKKGNVQERIDSKTTDEIVDGLKMPLSFVTRTLLKRFLIAKARDGVRQREEGKSLFIKVSDIFKQAYWRLAAMMVCEGRLPDERLVFFLTHHEIGKLLDCRSVRLIRLAKHRLRLWPEMNRIKYPKINIGRPKPIQRQMKSMGSAFTLKGMPVCLGKVDGKARVIKNVEKADEIREGDILICNSTDIGWSPYFCLISGLVTELGGLLSHGAVIARECGIPCIVNISDVTDIIKTGDHVLLDGGAGTLSKLEK